MSNYHIFKLEEKESLLKEIIDESSLSDCVWLLKTYNLSDEIVKYIFDSKNIEMPIEYSKLLKYFEFNIIDFINNYNLVIRSLEESGIENSKFTQYGINVEYDWLDAMLKIINSNKLNEFIEVKDYFFNSYYLKNNDNEVLKTRNYINILCNYIKYPELCLSIMRENKELTHNLKNNMKFLFESTDFLDDDIRPKNVDELDNIKKLFEKKYRDNLENIDLNDIDNIKNILCKLLFNMDLASVKNKLLIYGDTKSLRQLLFNNRKNIEISSSINEMMIYTSMMDAIVNCNDTDYLFQMAKRTLDNYDLSIQCMVLFNQYDEKMRRLYEKELFVNLTSLKDGDVPQELKDEEMSKHYGVDVIDFTDKMYCLAYHVKSYSETAEELVKGTASFEKNTICISIGSHRNQVLYSDGMIFATDEIPNGSFMRSSTSNMSSNGSVKRGSFNDPQINSQREQRGALEVSSAPYGINSEVLCFREGLKFKYIILPGGRQPAYEEIIIAKKYGLKFIKTQPLKSMIENPQEIDRNLLKSKGNNEEKEEIDDLKKVQQIIQNESQKKRKIAIFTDAHAMFEPTLAILEDARKQGIAEIYSLGDNIGTGPNPKEVLDLLKEYGVISLKGNHELYASGELDSLEEHLKSSGALEEARRNSTWTKSQLSEEEIERIKQTHESRIIEVGGIKILLTHYIYDYNTGVEKEIPECINAVFQGHVHFEGKSLSGKMIEVRTLRGAGIGESSNYGNAYYIIITEKDNGGYDIEKREVSYDLRSFGYDVNESSMDIADKNKIQEWSGIKK